MAEQVPHPQPLTRRERKDLKVLARFTAVYCRVHHAGAERQAVPLVDQRLQNMQLRRFPVCADCREFLQYAFERRLRCPLPEKPACKHCHVHCYRPGHRERVREIMRFAGPYLIRRGRLDLLWHYFF